MRTSHLALLLSPFLGAALSAQAPPHLVGNTRLIPTLRHLGTDCTPLSQCALAGMPPTANLFAGGNAWDPVTSGVWVTNGRMLAKYGDDCSVQCPPMPIPSLGSVDTFVTGMEVVEGLDQLWMIDNDGRLSFYSNACPPTLLGGCNSVLVPTPLPNAQVTTGLAVDEGYGLVFVAYPNFGTGLTRIVVNDLAHPCVQVDLFTIPPCTNAFGTVTGLACDWGNRTLYATDGRGVVAIRYVWSGFNLTIVDVDCCAGPAITLDEMVGLALRPGRATSLGTPCAGGACPNCPMAHRLDNDPVLGNLDFRLRLDGAFGSAFAFCLIGEGPCRDPGIVTPALCGPIRTLPFLGYLGPNLIMGPSICGNSTTFDLPLPLTPSLVGGVYSSQCLNLCVTATSLGIALSNCLSWELQGS